MLSLLFFHSYLQVMTTRDRASNNFRINVINVDFTINLIESKFFVQFVIYMQMKFQS